MFNPGETVWQRGLAETRRWSGRHGAIRWLAFLLAAAGGVAFSLLTPGNSYRRAILYGLAAAIAGFLLLLLLVLIWYLLKATRLQRNDARKEFLRLEKIVRDIEPKLQETTASLDVCRRQLSNIEGKHKALVQAYQPELEAVKPGDTIKGKKFNVSLLFNQMNTKVISNVTFENCTFTGPSVVMLMGSSELTGTSFGGNIENVVVKADPGKGYQGMCAFLNCTIRNCKLENVGILGDESLKEKLKKQAA